MRRIDKQLLGIRAVGLSGFATTPMVLHNALHDEAEDVRTELGVEALAFAELAKALVLFALAVGVNRVKLVVLLVLADAVGDLEAALKEVDEFVVDLVDARAKLLQGGVVGKVGHGAEVENI